MATCRTGDIPSLRKEEDYDDQIYYNQTNVYDITRIRFNADIKQYSEAELTTSMPKL